MSDVSEELEGDVEDFEGDGDLNDWALFECMDELDNSKNSATKVPRSDTRSNEQTATDVPTSSKETSSRTVTPRSSESKKTQEFDVKKGGTQSRNAHKNSEGKEGSPKSSITENYVPSTKARPQSIHIGETARNFKGNETHPKERTLEIHMDAPKKRKLVAQESSSSSKVSKVDNESDILLVIDSNLSHTENSQEKVEDKDQEARSKSKEVTRKLEEVEHVLTEEEFKNLDNWLVDGMIDAVKEELTPETGDKYTIRFSPVELADLAEPSVQDLIKSQPNLAFYLKRQGKFKKKKGYAEVYLSQLQDVRAFISRLLQVKLVEHFAEIIITVSQVKKEPKFLSLTIWFSKRNKLLKLLESSEDLSKVKPGVQKEKFVIDSVPASATPQLLKIIFPYATNVLWASEKKVHGTGFQGPVNIFYASEKCLEAVLECCTDFSFNGCALDIQYSHQIRDLKPKPASEQEYKDGLVTERQSSAQDLVAQEEISKDETSQDSGTSGPDAASSQSDTLQGTGSDDDISSMTLDVCAGMMESLNKLKQLGTANPDVLKMQSQLIKLQEALLKGSEKTSSTAADSDPWTVNASDTQNMSTKTQEPGQSKTENKKLTKEAKRKQENEKQRKEMENLQNMIEKADEAEREREEKTKQKIEMERQKFKELEESRKSSWARKMIEDAKLQGNSSRDHSPATKQEVQRMLKTFETKHKECADLSKQETGTEEGSEIAGSPEDGKSLSSESQSKQTLATQLPSRTGSKSRKVSLATVLARRKDALAQQKAEEKKDEVVDTEEKVDVAEGKETEESIQAAVPPLTDVKAITSDRPHHNGIPVYTDKEYQELCGNSINILPSDYYIQVSYSPNRRCPVSKCPATTYFKTEASFADHWEIFHKPNVTMRFCSRCTAYFMNITELENHLSNLHSVTDPQMVKKLSSEARVKVVSNPSYRDAGRYLPPMT